jgi:hypothetical protein
MRRSVNEERKHGLFLSPRTNMLPAGFVTFQPRLPFNLAIAGGFGALAGVMQHLSIGQDPPVAMG